MKSRLVGFLLLVWTAPLFAGVDGELQQALEHLETHLHGEPKTRRSYLVALEQIVKRRARSRVHHGASQVSLETDGLNLFTQTPILPPENKKQGRWHFERHRFEVIPRHLFLYNLRFKGDHTIRLRTVTLYFHDGTQITYNSWAALEDGNGRAFSRRVFGPPLHAWRPEEGSRARRLKALEIEGSAQDSEHAARLDFLFTIPDPSEQPYQNALALIGRLKRRWSEPVARTTLDKDMKALQESLED